MALYSNNEKLTELVGYEDGGYVRISDKIIYFNDLKAWKRNESAKHQFLDVEIVYTKALGENAVGKFIYNESGELYAVSANDSEYCFYVKSYDETSDSMVVSYDTYENIKNGTLSGEYPLGEEAIVYDRYNVSDKTL